MSLVVLGLDGATWRNLEPWMERGELPNLASLVEDGSSGTLLSTVPCTTVPAVPALTTGKGPASLGLFNFTQPDGSVIDAHDVDFPAIWDALAPEHRSLVANLRSTYPPYDVEGTMIAGDLFLPADADDYVSPESKYDELSDFHDEERIERWNELARSPEEHPDELLAVAREDVRRKYDHFARLWTEESYEFGLFWIGKTDAVQHHFWHDQDRILSFYRFVDDIVGEIRDELAPDDFVLLSDHGFGQVPERRFHVNTWLQREGHLSVTGGRLGAVALGVGQQVLTERLPKSVLRTVHEAVYGADAEDDGEADDSVLEPAFGAIPGIDDAGTTAKLTHPWGISVPSGDDRVIDDVVAGLQTVTDERGEPVVQDAWRREELFAGPYLEEVPEVVFLTTDRYRAVPQLSRSLFTDRPARRTIGEHPVTGEHNSMRDGVLVLHGPSFASADDVSVEMTDVAPTLVHALGRAVPESMDGDVRTDLLATDRPVEYTELEVSRGGGADRSEDEEDEVRQRLQNLGYLDGE